MSDKVIKNVVITSMVKVTDGIYSMWIKDKDLACNAKPGQFVSLYCKEGSQLLPRPISICEIDRENETLRLVYRVVGKGTKEFSKMNAGDTIRVMGPLGNGFTLEGKKAILIGGGIGIPPMFLKDEFTSYGKVIVSTEDGSVGTKGNVIDAIREKDVQGDIIFACGPTPMLRGVKAYAQEKGLKAQLSLEEKMACGIGACLACVCQSKEVDSHTHVKNKRICKDGPVFYAEEVEL